MSNLQHAKDLYELIFTGRLMDGFEKYYAEDVVMQELGEEPRVGKAVNRAYEQQFLENCEAVHGGGVTGMASDEENGLVFIDNWMDATMKGMGRVKFEQVAVQTWKDGQIVSERFYHK
jgi:ketosteroid isomerase-like protein